jgi:flagellar biosynthetic protein FliO
MTEIIAKIRKWLEASSKKQKLVVALLAFSLLSTGMLLSLGNAASVAQDPPNSTPFYFLSAFVKLMAVLLLIVGSSVIFRRWLQPGLNGKTTRQMHLLETIRLSPKQALHLVLIGDQKLLIGATDQNVSLIAPIEDGLVPIPVEESQPQPGVDFGAMIQSFNFSNESIQVKDKSQP